MGRGIYPVSKVPAQPSIQGLESGVFRYRIFAEISLGCMVGHGLILRWVWTLVLVRYDAKQSARPAGKFSRLGVGRGIYPVSKVPAQPSIQGLESGVFRYRIFAEISLGCFVGLGLIHCWVWTVVLVRYDAKQSARPAGKFSRLGVGSGIYPVSKVPAQPSIQGLESGVFRYRIFAEISLGCMVGLGLILRWVWTVVLVRYDAKRSARPAGKFSRLGVGRGIYPVSKVPAQPSIQGLESGVFRYRIFAEISLGCMVGLGLILRWVWTVVLVRYDAKRSARPAGKFLRLGVGRGIYPVSKVPAQPSIQGLESGVFRYRIFAEISLGCMVGLGLILRWVWTVVLVRYDAKRSARPAGKFSRLGVGRGIYPVSEVSAQPSIQGLESGVFRYRIFAEISLGCMVGHGLILRWVWTVVLVRYDAKRSARPAGKFSRLGVGWGIYPVSEVPAQPSIQGLESGVFRYRIFAEISLGCMVGLGLILRWVWTVVLVRYDAKRSARPAGKFSRLGVGRGIYPVSEVSAQPSIQGLESGVFRYRIFAEISLGCMVGLGLILRWVWTVVLVRYDAKRSARPAGKFSRLGVGRGIYPVSEVSAQPSIQGLESGVFRYRIFAEISLGCMVGHGLILRWVWTLVLVRYDAKRSARPAGKFSRLGVGSGIYPVSEVSAQPSIQGLESGVFRYRIFAEISLGCLVGLGLIHCWVWTVVLVRYDAKQSARQARDSTTTHTPQTASR
ncbi:hypothetical protein [Pontibacter sp. G13]|uniref:hypothetical protein n=1 Tax=Pontibacter sp. G13 TaxID=3074898 RepID=UPI002889A860|nr:hypothetical protein [Pontibacter sp. G13]WNJ20273.1 hypothetical protein RJD25_07320 [Pontibacter sp. G13]